MTSTRLPATHQATPPRRRAPSTVKGLAALLGLLTIGSLRGGIAMIIDPLEPLGMSTTHLKSVPIDTYLWPGVFLVCLGVAGAVTAVGLLAEWHWTWAAPIESTVRHRWPWIGALATGGALLAFEIVELFVLPFHPIMHPLLIGMALAIIGLALTRSVSSHLAVDDGDETPRSADPSGSGILGER